MNVRKLRERFCDAMVWMIKIFKGRADGMGEVAVIENAEQALKEYRGENLKGKRVITDEEVE